jgi:hypothetical protein
MDPWLVVSRPRTKLESYTVWERCASGLHDKTPARFPFLQFGLRAPHHIPIMETLWRAPVE